jgi:hypothetical protein
MILSPDYSSGSSYEPGGQVPMKIITADSREKYKQQQRKEGT